MDAEDHSRPALSERRNGGDEVVEGSWDVPLKVADAARLLNVSPATLYREIQDGRLRAVRIRGTWRIRHSEIERYLESNDTQARGKHFARR